MYPQKQLPAVTFSGWITLDRTAEEGRSPRQLKHLNALIDKRKDEFKTDLPDTVEIRLHQFERDPVGQSRWVDVDNADVCFHLGDIFANLRRHEDQRNRNQGQDLYPRDEKVKTQLTPRKMPFLWFFGGESMADYLTRLKTEAKEKLEELRFLRPVSNQNERYAKVACLLSAQLHQAKMADVEEGVLESSSGMGIQPHGVVLLMKPEDIEHAKQVLRNFGCREAKKQEQPEHRVQLYFDDIPVSLVTLENFKTEGICWMEEANRSSPTRYYLDEAKLAPLNAPISYFPMELKDQKTGQRIGNSYLDEARTQAEKRKALHQMQVGMELFKKLMPLGNDDSDLTN